jgi:hypothetical protein
MKLRQTQRAAAQADWTEHFYSGAVKVVKGEVDVPDEKFEWINQLKYRGFTEVDAEPAPTPEVEDIDPQLEETIHNDEPFEPLGTQVVDEDTEIPSEIQEEAEPSVQAELEETTEESAEGTSDEEQPSRPRKHGRPAKAEKETDNGSS